MTSYVEETMNRANFLATITDEMVEQELSRLGKPINMARPYIEVTTADAVRHWVEGIGDRNPLWINQHPDQPSSDQEMLAPPTIILALIPRGSSGFRGIHAWNMGLRFEWTKPVRQNCYFDANATVESLKEVESEYVVGRAFDQTVRIDVTERDTGALVCRYRSHGRRFERQKGADTKKYTLGSEPTTYTVQQLEDLAAKYESESIRGSNPRFIEDIRVGDELDPIVRGPLTITDCVAFVRGWGGVYVMAHGNMWEFLRKHPGAFPPNENNVPDSPERTHWNESFARSIGAPAPFDYGPQRVAWCGTLLTNWCGDLGTLCVLDVRLARPNYFGDVTTIIGTVTKVDTERDEVHVDLKGSNQRDEISVYGQAVLGLPSKS